MDNSKFSDSENESVSSDEEEDGLIDFTAEEEKKFEWRFEEGYNLYDPKYLSWLKINHPETTLQPSFSFLLPSEQDILPASQKWLPWGIASQ